MLWVVRRVHDSVPCLHIHRYLNNYMNGEGEKRKKRNSKRNTVEPVPPAAAQLQRLIAGDKSGQVAGCVNKINQLQVRQGLVHTSSDDTCTSSPLLVY